MINRYTGTTKHASSFLAAIGACLPGKLVFNLDAAQTARFLILVA
jgi:hypothetical protein